MPKKARMLSDREVRQLNKPGFYNVGGPPGLLLQVSGAGGRSWVLRATIAGRVRGMGLGSYPYEVTLAQARELAREYRDIIRQGRDPIDERRQAKAECPLGRSALACPLLPAMSLARPRPCAHASAFRRTP